ncbi:MAG: hypothetical protein ABL917_02825 [Parcubacteria group bacterium]
MEKISWQTHEYHHTEKTSDWYWIVGIVTVSIAIIAIILNNIIFALLIIVSSITLSLFASKKPEIIDVNIDNSGITINKTRYPYSHLDSFWVELTHFRPRIILKSKKLLMPYIVIFIEEVEPEEIRSVLSSKLEEVEHHEPFLEKLLIYLGF